MKNRNRKTLKDVRANMNSYPKPSISPMKITLEPDEFDRFTEWAEGRRPTPEYIPDDKWDEEWEKYNKQKEKMKTARDVPTYNVKKSKLSELNKKYGAERLNKERPNE